MVRLAAVTCGDQLGLLLFIRQQTSRSRTARGTVARYWPVNRAAVAPARFGRVSAIHSRSDAL
jgi:hypothetical protein